MKIAERVVQTLVIVFHDLMYTTKTAHETMLAGIIYL